MRMRYLPAAVALLTAPLVANTPAQATQADLSWSCGAITIKNTFDNDQTGGWWVVTTSMNCTPGAWPKRYSNEISDRPFTKYYLFDHTSYVSRGYDKTIIIDATPAKANKSACVEARAELYFPNRSLATEKSRNACFKTAAP
ncbi:hypothetical protein F1D05_05910 [Kribbella qitaiheensis]|uniref:DUF1036 domain-containing protein n=1 Tax=Kribbella qitaiheensis TaxID=1544730 RepID=A0A7G6WU63_9ACTN|nr:hypothetical protein [Kribbella qitaiheensis]QNE17528.1 hypothetical protein F1D05_05910 [Kribbella qitaiheensis]